MVIMVTTTEMETTAAKETTTTAMRIKDRHIIMNIKSDKIMQKEANFFFGHSKKQTKFRENIAIFFNEIETLMMMAAKKF